MAASKLNTWYVKGRKAFEARKRDGSPKYWNVHDAWAAMKRKPSKSVSAALEAEADFYAGFQGGKKHRNPSTSTASLVGARIAKVLKNAKGQIIGVVAHVEQKVKKAVKKNPARKKNIAGFRDANGIFHPIRSGVRLSYSTAKQRTVARKDVSPYVEGAKPKKKKAAPKKKTAAKRK